MRVLPGVLGYRAWPVPASIVHEVRGARLHDFSEREHVDYIPGTRKPFKRAVAKAAQRSYVSLAHGEAEVERTLAAFDEAFSAGRRGQSLTKEV